MTNKDFVNATNKEPVISTNGVRKNLKENLEKSQKGVDQLMAMKSD